MPAPITQCLLTFMESELTIIAWGSEVPRFDPSGNPINPQATVSPGIWPVVTCVMETPFHRNWNCGCDPYDDVGGIKIQVWGTTKASVQAALDQIEALWAQSSKWQAVAFSPPGDQQNPFYLIEMELESWWLDQVENERLNGSLLLFRGDLVYNPTRIHGAISTS